MRSFARHDAGLVAPLRVPVASVIHRPIIDDDGGLHGVQTAPRPLGDVGLPPELGRVQRCRLVH